MVISKQDMRLSLISYKGDTLFCAPIAVGKAYGNKRKRGDMRTPEGVFQVVDIHRTLPIGRMTLATGKEK